MGPNTQPGVGSRRRRPSGKPAAQQRTKGEAVQPVAVLQLIAEIGVTAAHRLLGVSTTTLHKARKPGAVVSKVIELASEAQLREMQKTSGETGAVHIATPAVAHVKMDGNKQLIIMKVSADRAEDLEHIARAWGAEFTKA